MQPFITLEVSEKYPLPQHIRAGIDAFSKEFGRPPVRIWIPYDIYQRAMWEFALKAGMRPTYPKGDTVEAMLAGGEYEEVFGTPTAQEAETGAEPPAIDSINGLSVTVYVPTAKYDQEILIL